MTTTAQRPAVQLHLQAAVGDDEVAGLRRQLAACLCGGATHVSVVVHQQADLDLSVLQALNGVADYLHRRGGALTLVGVQPRLATKIAVHGLARLRQAADYRQEGTP